MEEAKTIAHEIGGVQSDTLRFGLHAVKSEILESHPLEASYRNAKKSEAEMKRKMLGNTYGMAFPHKMDLDRQILCRFQRPPGSIPSSLLGLEAFTGSMDDFGFEDYLDDPRESEMFRSARHASWYGGSPGTFQRTSLPKFHLILVSFLLAPLNVELLASHLWVLAVPWSLYFPNQEHRYAKNQTHKISK